MLVTVPGTNHYHGCRLNSITFMVLCMWKMLVFDDKPMLCFLEELEPNWKMMMFERLGAPGEESSNGFNNAGAWTVVRSWLGVEVSCWETLRGNGPLDLNACAVRISP